MAKDKTEEEQTEEEKSVEDQAKEATAEKAEEAEEAEEKPLPIAVVKELPLVENRIGEDKDGNKYSLITHDEAMTEIYNKVMEIQKAVG